MKTLTKNESLKLAREAYRARVKRLRDQNRVAQGRKASAGKQEREFLDKQIHMNRIVAINLKFLYQDISLATWRKFRQVDK